MPASPTRAQLPARAMSSFSPPPCRTSRRWRSDYSGHHIPPAEAEERAGRFSALLRCRPSRQSAWQRILWGMISRQTDRLPRCKRDKMKPRWRTGPQANASKRDLLSEEGHTIVRTQRTAEGKRAFEQITPVMAEPRTPRRGSALQARACHGSIWN